MKNKLFILCISLLFSMSMQAQNAINVISPQTSVNVDAMITYNVSYTKIIPEAAYVLIRFKSPSGDNLEFALQEVTANSGTIALTVKAPSVVGSNYKIQAQLLRKSNWAGLKTYNRSGITVTQPTASNTITVINPQTSVAADAMITYNVNYNKIITAAAYVLIRFKAQNGDNLEFALQEVTANSGTIPLTVKAPSNAGSNYSIQAQLLRKSNWAGLKTVNLSGITVTGSGGSGPMDANGTVTYDPNHPNNDYYKQNLGEGYWTNWFIDPSWVGDMSANFGPAEQYSWIDFDNQGGNNGHGEIDIKIQKASWNENNSSTRGYPTKIKNVTNNLTCELEGNWSSGSKGRAFINMTAWVTETEAWVAGTNRCDIIVHTWDNSGDLHKKYATYESEGRGGLEVLQQFTTNRGVSYHVLKRNGGGNGEVATYNLVPVSNPLRQDVWSTNFSTSTTNHEIDMKDIINRLYTRDQQSTTPSFNKDWYIHILEWTVVPSGGDTVDDDYIGNAQGRFNFHNYTIPNLTGAVLGKSSNGKTKTAAESTPSKEENSMLNDDAISIFPNPFKNSFTYTFNSTDKESVLVELFSVDGKKVHIDTSNNVNNNITVDTSNLSTGIYIIRATTNKGIITKKIIKY